MSLNYDPTAYETWRQNYEMREALAWFGGCIWYFMWGNFMGANGATLGFVLCCAVMAIMREKLSQEELYNHLVAITDPGSAPPYGATT